VLLVPEWSKGIHALSESWAILSCFSWRSREKLLESVSGCQQSMDPPGASCLDPNSLRMLLQEGAYGRLLSAAMVCVVLHRSIGAIVDHVFRMLLTKNV